MQQNRVLYLDVVRIFACLWVLVFHFNAAVCGFEKFGSFIYPNYLISNRYLTETWAGLFFVLSGACLQYVYGELSLNKKALWNFYKKRIKSLYPMYWFSFILLTMMAFLYTGTYFPINKWHLLASLAGIDGYMMVFTGIPYETYQCGEWFLGCILCLYAIYPLISWGANRFPKTTSLIAMLIYAIGMHLNVTEQRFFLQIPYILLGIFFVKYFKTTFSWRLWAIVCAGMMIRIFNHDFFTTYTIRMITTASIFVFIAFIVEFLEKKTAVFNKKGVVETISYFSVLTYPIFLVHHRIIIMLSNRFDLEHLSYQNIVMLFLTSMIIVTYVAIFVMRTTKIIQKQFA